MFRPFLVLLITVALAGPALAWDPTKSGRYGGLDLDRLTVGGAVSLPAIAQLDLTYAGTYNPNAIVMAPGNRVSFCPPLSCIRGPADGTSVPAFFDHQRASLLVSGTTLLDGAAEEQTLAVTTTIGTGYAKPYAALTAYAVGDNVNVGNATYRAVQAGMTGASSAPPGSRPASAPFTVTDGTVRWLWINDAAINAKVGLYNEVEVVAGGGNSWAQANNIMLKPGATPTFHAANELDFTNNSGTDCVAGVANCLGLYIRMAGSNRNTAAISVEGVEANARGLFGLHFTGPVADTTIDLSTSGVAGLGLGIFQPATYTSAAISDASTAPAGLNISGAKSLAAIRIAATGASGLDLRDGSFSVSQIVGTGWMIAPGGALITPAITATALPTAAGTVKGTLCLDTAGTVYVKTTSGACL